MASHDTAVSANLECRAQTSWMRTRQVETVLDALRPGSSLTRQQRDLLIDRTLAEIANPESVQVAEFGCGWIGDAEVIDNEWACPGCGAVHEVDPDFLDRP